MITVSKPESQISNDKKKDYFARIGFALKIVFPDYHDEIIHYLKTIM